MLSYVCLCSVKNIFSLWNTKGLKWKINIYWNGVRWLRKDCHQIIKWDFLKISIKFFHQKYCMVWCQTSFRDKNYINLNVSPTSSSSPSSSSECMNFSFQNSSTEELTTIFHSYTQNDRFQMGSAVNYLDLRMQLNVLKKKEDKREVVNKPRTMAIQCEQLRCTSLNTISTFCRIACVWLARKTKSTAKIKVIN